MMYQMFYLEVGGLSGGRIHTVDSLVDSWTWEMSTNKILISVFDHVSFFLNQITITQSHKLRKCEEVPEFPSLSVALKM